MNGARFVSVIAVVGWLVGCGGSESPATTGSAVPVEDSGSTEAAASEDSAPANDAEAADSGSPEVDASTPVDAAPIEGWGAEHCPTGGPAEGFAVGQPIGDLVVEDCETGAKASIDEVCGASAAWVFVAHTHCPTCRATAKYTANVAKAVASKGVAVVHVVHQDDSVTCAQWKKIYGLEGIPNLKVYADPSGAAWSALKTKSYTAPHAFVDGERVITYKEHGLDEKTVLAKIDEALAK